MRIIFLITLCFLFGIVAQAQSIPTIEYFTVDKAVLDYPAVEAGTETADFSWRTVGLREGDRMQMHAWVGGQWALIGENFEPEKSDTLVIAHPLDFILPKYRLSVVDSGGVIIAEQSLELPYTPQTELPAIAMFLTLHPRTVISYDELDEPLHVQWRVTNRWFNSNLVFEQIMPDGTVLNAEYERPVEWQYAHRADYVRIVYPGDYQDVVLRLRVVNRDDGSTLVQQDLVLAVDDSPAASAELVAFTVSPEVVNPSGMVTVTWEVTNTDVVFIEYHDGNPAGWCAGNLEEVYEDLPASGSLEVQAPEWGYTGLAFRIFADYYVGGSRHNCSSRAEPLAEATVNVTDYVGQDVVSFRVEPFTSTFGQQVTLSWEVSDGDSVTIIQLENDTMTAYGETPAAYETYSDLPLSGTLEVTIPDNPAVRASIGRYFLLYIIEDEPFPPVADRTAYVSIDDDGNLECDAALNVGDNANGIDTEVASSGTELLVEWDSCGNENTILRLALIEGSNYNDPPITEEFVMVASSGTVMLTMPDVTGTYYMELYYEHEGERYFLRMNSVVIEAAQG